MSMVICGAVIGFIIGFLSAALKDLAKPLFKWLARKPRAKSKVRAAVCSGPNFSGPLGTHRRKALADLEELE